MKGKLLRLCCSAALLVCASSGAHLQAHPLWGTLQAGPYAVGYKTLFTYDRSRPFMIDANASASLAPRQRGRQMQISIWYPSRPLVKASYMRFEEYLFLQARELDFGPLTAEKRARVKRDFMEGPLARGASATRLEALMSTQTAAIRNARPAAGRFPLIIFAHGSPPNQSIMCEYLASHGFVVAAVPSKGSFEYEFDVGLSGLETLIKDMEFVLASARELAQVDGQRLGLIGMSFGSAACIGLHTRNPEVGAMISLDGGIGEGGVGFLLTRTPYYDTGRIKAPLLHLYTPNNPNLDLSRIESYKYSDRYLVQIPRMRHGDFVGYGMLEQIVPGMFGPSPGDTKSGFEWTCRYALRFLDAALKEEREGQAFLQRPPGTNGVPRGLLEVTIKRGLARPPTARELKAVFEGDGVKGLAGLYAARKARDPQPFTYASMVEVSDWLFMRKQYDAGRELARLFLDSYPNSARAHTAAANVAEQSGDKELARTHFAEALRLLCDDAELDFRTRKRLEQLARQALERLR